MVHGEACKTGRIEQAVIAALVVSALVAFGSLILAPRAGEPVALIPLGGDAVKAIPTLIAAPETLLLARGSLPGSYVVRGDHPGFVKSLTRHRVLILNATAPGCGPVGTGAPA